MKDEPHYTNNHGKVVSQKISRHAQARFQQRWSNLFPDNPLGDDEVDPQIARWFSRAKRVEAISNKERFRLEKYGKDTLLFRANELTFIVKDATIVTIEISAKSKRHLNKRPIILSSQSNSPQQPSVKKENGLPSSHPSFKKFAWASDGDGILHSVNLGSYTSVGVNGDAQRLKEDMIFVAEILYRFQNKHTTLTLLAVFAQLGKKSHAIQVLETTDLPIL